MAADTLTYTASKRVKRFTMEGTPGNLRAVTVSGRYRRLVLTFMQAGDVLPDAGKFNFDGTLSDAASIGNDWSPVYSGEQREVVVSRSQGGPNDDWRINLAGATATGFCHVEAYEY